LRGKRGAFFTKIKVTPSGLTKLSKEMTPLDLRKRVSVLEKLPQSGRRCLVPFQ